MSAQRGDDRVVGGRYRILTEIGRGGMSTVYLALDTNLNKQWAIKEIRHLKDKSDARRIINSLISEANLIKTFDHPAIPRIVDLIEEDGSFYIVMDYVEGQTLERFLEDNGKCSDQQAVSWGIQLCDVLDYLHRLDPPTVYRDLKPSNVMVTPEGAVRIIDFGIACVMPAKDGPLPDKYEARMGTPGYAAPEQYDKYGRCDSRTDVYGLGALLYTLLVGKKAKGEPYDLPPLRQVVPEASAGLERVLAKALQKNPDERYQSCAQFAYDLEHAGSKDMQLRKSMKHKWQVFCTVCVATLVLTLAGGITLGAGALAASSSYEHYMNLAEQSSDDKAAEGYYVTAADIKPSASAPYEGLIKRYEADGKLDDNEDEQLQQSLDEHADNLRNQDDDWGGLSFDIGKLYWYYYSPSHIKSSDAAGSQIQHVRMLTAESWMKEAAGSGFPDSKLANLYATMANFESTIVPLINEGSDQGKYAPYFNQLTTFMKYMDSSNNDVMRLSTANLVLDAVRVYARKFRADGISQKRLSQSVESAQHLAEQSSPTTDKLQRLRNQALGAVPSAGQAVSEAFVDITGGVTGKEAK